MVPLKFNGSYSATIPFLTPSSPTNPFILSSMSFTDQQSFTQCVVVLGGAYTSCDTDYTIVDVEFQANYGAHLYQYISSI